MKDERYTIIDTWVALMKHVEVRQLDDDGAEWGRVCLEKARIVSQSPDQFQRHLERLCHIGIYRPTDDDGYGMILL